MNISKKIRYVIVGGLVLALFLAPATKAIASVSSEMARVQSEAEAFEKEATSPAHKTVAGLQSQIGGYYMATGVQGVFLAPAAGTSAANLFVKVMDTDKEKSSAAVTTATIAATAELGPTATVGPCINISYGQNVNGSFVPSTTGSSGILSVGIHPTFQTIGAKYAIVAVYSGGAYKVYLNGSTDPSVITVATDQAISSDVMYAVVKY